MRKYIFITIITLSHFFVNAQNDKGTPVVSTPILRKSFEQITPLETPKTTENKSNTAGTASPPTGTSTEVGTTQGQLTVSLSGAANYSIPIAAAPGINGVVPQVSLEYSSQRGDGIAGRGWTIAGVSMISRIPSTQFHDGTIDPVDFDALDRFALDGQRLLLKDPAAIYGGDGVEYVTENYSNLKITSYGVSSYGGPNYFKVQYPDGSVALYGNTANSVSRTDWGITYWQNPQGIKLSYNYTTIGNCLYIRTITHGVSDTEIHFWYNTKQRSEQAYIGGISFDRDQILASITVVGAGHAFRGYLLTYETTDLGYQRLKSLREGEYDDPSVPGYNPTVFTYDTTPDTLNANTSTFSLNLGGVNYTNSGNVTGDFDGGGKMDFALYPTTGTDARKKFWLFRGLDDQSLNMGYEVSTGTELPFVNLFPSTFLDTNNKLLPYQGITIVKSVGNSTVGFKTYYYEDFSSGVTLKYSRDVYFGDYIGNYLSGDFNGDGLTDVLAISLYTKATHFVDLDRRITSDYTYDSGNIEDIVGADDKLIVTDFDGDGKSDLLHFKTGIVKVYSLNDAKQLKLIFTFSDPSINLTYPILLGDYNGDGKSDFIIPKGYGTAYAKFLSTGVSFIKSDQTYPVAYQANTSIYSHILVPNDFNNDGKTDLTETTSAYYQFLKSTNPTYPSSTAITGCDNCANGYGYVTISNYKNTGTTFVAGTSGTIGKTSAIPDFYTNQGSSYIKSKPVPLFLTSCKSNLNLSLSFLTNDRVLNFNSDKDFSKETLLRKVTNGNGVDDFITYNPLKKISLPYYPGYEFVYRPKLEIEVYPNIDILSAPDFQVVSRIESRGLKQDYAYSGGVSNVAGLGFLGFRGVAKTNFYSTDIPVKSTTSYFDPALRGAIVQDYTYLGFGVLDPDNINADTVITSSVYIYDLTNLLQANKVFNLKNTVIEKRNLYEGGTFITTMGYDAFKNVISSQTITNQAKIVKKKELTEIAYDNDALSTTDYHIGRPTSKKVTLTVGSSIMKSEEQYAYGTGTSVGLLTSIKRFVDNDATKNVIEENQYDSFGNITQKKITASDVAQPRLIKYEYSNSSDPNYGGRFLTKMTDVTGLSTNYTYDESTGLMTSQTSPQSTTDYPIYTNYTYDALGKRKTAQTFLGTALTNSNTYSYTKFSTTNSSYTIAQVSNDGSEIKTIYDPLNRPYITGVKNINGTWSYKQVVYDALDRKIQESEPYFSTATPPVAPGGTLWNTISYDEYGRVKQTVAAAGNKTTTITYSGLTTTVDDTVKVVSTTKNANGTIASVTDPGGTINYVYYANDVVKTATFGSNVVSNLQDGWGRKTQLVDTSAGTYSYTYNLFGDLKTETTPNGTTTYTIDDYGRVTQKAIVGNLTNTNTLYTYYPDTKLLKTTAYTDGSFVDNRNYEYDNFKRLSVVKEYNPYASYQHSVTYDGFNRLSSELYAGLNETNTTQHSDKWITHTYKNGYDWQIIDGSTASGTVLWQTESVNARGQLLTAHYAGTVGEENHTYDNYGFPTAISYKTSSSSTPFLNLATAFEPKSGNLSTRTNSMFLWNENFTYDGANRLTKITDASGDQVQDYEDNGRIKTNALGTYTYSSTKQYQNIGITATPTAVSYYQNYSLEQITYNALKKPVTITETGKELIDFQYNDSQQRSAMFYGGTQTDKTLRPLRKFYSADGSMEITIDKTIASNPVTTFITYIGGDAYTAPIILKSDGTAATQKYYYLHRDNQGSILAITDPAGSVIEKRFFDAWGQLTKYADAAGNTKPANGRMFIDRGYTGHEHILPTFDGTNMGYGLINMNGRLYDPRLHRFLMPDNNIQEPYNTQNYNRYGYVLNNPLMYTDPTGEDFDTGCGCYVNNNGNDYQNPNYIDGINNGGINPNAQQGIGSAITTLAANWDDWGIKDWSHRAFRMKPVSNFLSNNAKSIGNWFGDRWNDVKSFFGGGHDRPAVPQYQLNGAMPNVSGMSTANYMSGGLYNGRNEDGLTYGEWSKQPWYKQILSTNPKLYDPYRIADSGMLGFISGEGELKFVQYSGEALKSLKGTEIGAQSEAAITNIMNKMKVGDMSIYADGIYTYLYNGERYILGGHHRIQAAIRSGEAIEAIELSGMKMYNQFGAKMEEIWAGLHF